MPSESVTPKYWNSEPGGTAAGRVIDADVVEGSHGPYVMLTLEDDSGDRTPVRCWHDNLRQQLRKRGVQIGDQITVTYLGRADDGDPMSAALYRVQGGREPKIDFATTRVGPAGEIAATPAAVPDVTDVPIDDAGLPEPAPAPPTVSERAEASFGDDLPF